jgi:type II secretory pathway pseudopilin PulG
MTMKLLRPSRRSDRGYILLALIFAVFLLSMAALATGPHLAQQIQREREQELIRRGGQYARAVQLFYRRFGRFPARIEELEGTNNIRFLRRRYADPITGKEEWRIIHFGQARATPRGVAGMPGAVAGHGTPASSLGQQAAQPGSQPGVPAQQISRPLGGQTMGGAGIVGVASTSEKQGVKEINGKRQYNEWEFVYDPRLDPVMQQRQGQPGAGQPQRPGQPGQPQQQPTAPGAPRGIPVPPPASPVSGPGPN